MRVISLVLSVWVVVLICYAVGLVAACCCLLLQLRLVLFACVSVLVVWVVYIGHLGCGLGLMFVSCWCDFVWFN